MGGWRSYFKGGLGLLDVALALFAFFIAYSTRQFHFPTTLIYGDWEPFLRGTNDLAFAFPMVAEASPFYTSVPLVFFAGLIRLFHDPAQVFQAWYTLGALAAPVLYFAIRPIAGPIAALAGALILAFAPADIHVVIGVKSPYIISLFSALACLGLTASFMKRPWGPPVMVAGFGGAVGCHSGLWLQSIVGSALAIGLTFRLKGWRRWASLGSLLAIGGAYIAIVYVRDLNHLRNDLALFRRLGPPPPQGGGNSVQANALEGLSLSYSLIKPMGYVLAASIVALIPQGLIALWRRRKMRGDEPKPSDGPPPSESPYFGAGSRARHRLGVAVGVSALALSVLGGGHYAKLAVTSQYLEVHHLVGLVPWLAFLLGTLPVTLSIPALRVSHMVVPALVLGFWLQDVELKAKALENRITAAAKVSHRRGPPGFLVYEEWAAIAKPIREDARALQRAPVVYSWLAKRMGERGSLATQIVNELARMGWPADGYGPACYLITEPGKWEGEQLLATTKGPTLEIWSYPSCDDLKAKAALLCDESTGQRLRRRRAYGSKDIPGEILPCALWNETIRPFSGPESIRENPPPPPPFPGGLPQPTRASNSP